MKYVVLLLSAAVLFFLSIFFLSNNDSKVVIEEKPLVSSMTVSVPVPDEVVFCGNKMKLNRYDLRERYDREINAFTYFHSTTMILIKRANRYFPIIEPILKKNDIPEDFKYLAVIESNLDVRAVSPAKAVGLWQFMPDTGKRYGLEVSSEVDERYHIEKATQAACKYFKEAYRKYGDWASVAASYNAGMGRISNELQSQNADSALDLLLVEETSRYVFRIIAAKSIFENPYKYGFILKRENLYKPIKTKEVDVTGDIPDFTEFAKKYGISYADLKNFNVWLRDRKLTNPKGKKYSISIPDKDDLYYGKEDIKVHNQVWIIEP